VKHPERHLLVERTGEELRLRPVVSAIGTLEAAAIAAAGRAAIEDARGVSRVVIDLSDVAFVNSAGLGAIIDLRHRAVDAGAAVRAEGLRDEVARLFRLLHLGRLFEID